MVRRGLILILLILLIPGVLSASVAIDSVRQARVMVYKMLNMDTTGTSNLPTAYVDQYVNMGIAQANEDLSGYQRSDSVQVANNVQMYAIDSVIDIKACWLVSDGELSPLTGLGIDSLDRKFFNTVNLTEDEKPEYYYKWGDSIGFLPEPNEADTFNVYYVHVIPLDSMRLLPYKYRYGAILWAVYISTMSVDMQRAEAFYKAYGTFIMQKKQEIDNK